MMACCVNFSACSSDENEPEALITNELTTIKAGYSVSLSEDWYRFFDIEVTYTCFYKRQRQTFVFSAKNGNLRSL